MKTKTQKVQDNRNILKIKNSVSNLETLHLICREHFLLSLYKPKSVSLKSHCFIKPSVTRSQNYNLNNLPIFILAQYKILSYLLFLKKKKLFFPPDRSGIIKNINYILYNIYFYLGQEDNSESCWGQRIIKAQPGSWESPENSFAVFMEDIYQHHSYRA